MKTDCAKWKDQLLEAALTGTSAAALAKHMLHCAACAEELAALRARRERLDTLLPLVAQGVEPSTEFRARVLAAAESTNERRRARPWQIWGLAGAVVVIAATLLIGLPLRRKPVDRGLENELAAAQKLAEWRAPTDGLLETPGRELLRTTPKLGESYLRLPVKTNEEK
jgi:ElaB/YqjD/DUF883 family membrane-anchored ribosome-binding protein